MSGDELITITIEDPHTNDKISRQYSVLSADFYQLTKGEFHLMMLDNLVHRFNKRKNEKPKI